MNDTKHTPGEWVVEKDLGRWIRAVTIPEDGGDIICNAPSDSPVSNERWPANRDRIVLCRNCHDDLVAALKALLATWDANTTDPTAAENARRLLAALAKAGEK